MWNIRSGRNGGLEFAARGLAQMGMDIAVLQETKLTGGIYTKQTNGYKVFASDAISAVKGGVALLWVEDHDLFEIESVRFPTPDVLTFKLVTGDSKWFVVSGYIAPTDNKTGDEIRKRIDQRPDGYKTLLLGDFNASLCVPMTARGDNIADMADEFNLSEFTRHYKQRGGTKDGMGGKRWSW